MLTRSIHTLFLTLLTASLITPPAWVMCLEPSGEVRVELAAEFCCGPSGNAPPTTAVDENTPGCAGCSDISISSPGLRAARAQGHDSIAPLSSPLATRPPLRGPVPCDVTRRGLQSGLPPVLAHLASTVITC